VIRIGIIGTGGFAVSHHRAVQALEATGECRLVCTCDPDAAAREAARAQWDWDTRGVRVYSDYREMLAAEGDHLDVMTIPTPIPLHAEMHRACVERGIACYLEKPPTLDPDELEEMIAVDWQAKRATQVAFNFIVEEPRQALKIRLLADEFGPMRRVTFVGLWPRLNSYFTRNGWAGRLLWHDGRLVLDSCIANAMAHYVHNLLFWAGTDALLSYANPTAVQAELYRAHDIETFDTCFVRAECDTDVELRIASTHACDGISSHWEVIECEAATIHYVTDKSYEIIDRNGFTIEQGTADKRFLLQENLRTYFAYVRGEAPRPLTRLIDSVPFVELNDLVYVAAGAITSVSRKEIRRSIGVDNMAKSGEYLAIDGVREACAIFAESGKFPTEQGVPWARPGAGIATPDDMPRLRSTVNAIRGVISSAGT